MSDLTHRIEELAAIIDEFGLDSASLKGDDWQVSFAKEPKQAVAPMMAAAVQSGDAAPAAAQPQAQPKRKAEPVGRPITSPMTGIYYSSPSPGSPPFVKVGDIVNAGDVVGLIEAMKVFNEITATSAGKVLKVAAESGQLVQPGDALVVLE